MIDVDKLLENLTPEQRKIALDAATEYANANKFIPTIGPQNDAFESKADVLLFGGQPAGGKSSLLIGIAYKNHKRSLIVRRQFADLEAIVDNAKRILGTDEGFVGGMRPKYNKPDGGVIHFQGMSNVDELDPSKQGADHDFIGVDEGAQLPKNKIMMLMGWNRTTDPTQRCRMVIASNPPVSSEGQWLAEFFSPWLDPLYPNPAKHGELRWFIMNEEGKSQEVDGPEEVTINGKSYHPHSRTYIPSSLEDNPYINAEEYRRKLELMPEPWRSIITSGNFLISSKDDDFQVCPMDWIREAVDRWKPYPPENVPMCAMGVDIAQGGEDETVIARRHDGWFDKLLIKDGKSTPHGRDVAAFVLSYRIGNPIVVIDMGGGFGGSPYEHLQINNDIKCVAYKGGEKATSNTKDGRLRFANKRAESWWKFREALDPNQIGGSRIALPNDPKLMADLASARIDPEKAQMGIIQLEKKEDIRARIGRSPDRGDAVVMAWSSGSKQEDSFKQWKARSTRQTTYKGNLPNRR